MNDRRSWTTDRRGFLGAAAGTLGAGLLAGCSKRLPRYLVPHTIPPDDAVPGRARYYRTICRECPAACGVTARVREGRVVKLEGNPEHPLSKGALCPRGQAAIEGLYSPDRLDAPRAGGGKIGWDAAESALAAGLKRALDANKLVVVLTRPEPGSVGALFRTWLTALGQRPNQVVTFDPMDRPWLREGAARAFGAEANPVPDLGAAKLLLSVGDDIVEEGAVVEQARALADLRAGGGRFVYIGPRLSLTAAAADEWLSVEPGSERALVLGLARRVLELGGESAPKGLPGALRARLASYDAATVAARTKIDRATLDRLARELAGARPSLCLGPGRAVAGNDAPAIAEALQVLNAVAGNLERTVRFLPRPQGAWTGPAMEIAELARRAAAGEVGALIVHHANPHGYGRVFADLAGAVEKVPFVAAFNNQLDETGRRAHLLLPDHHFLESWSDVTVRAGVTGIQQPAMVPILETRAAADELLAAARALGKSTGLPDGAFGDAVRASFDPKEVEHGGKFAEIAAASATLAEGVLDGARAGAALAGPADGLPLVVVPTVRALDGLPPTSALLQEIPDPLTNIAWGGWVELHPKTASALGVGAGDVLALDGGGGRTELPAHLTIGVREGVVAVPAGWALPLFAARAPALGLATRVRVARTGAQLPPPEPRGDRSPPGARLTREVGPSRRLPLAPALPSVNPPIEHPVHRWALAIDLDRCTGCGACVAACYVENNIPVVGAEEVARGRDMAWLSIQSFVKETDAGPEISFLPLGCQQCEKAPCETVCPTYATYHTREGLNAQVYARCVGTRYCENNCPYHVRRFNFFDAPHGPRDRLGLNPDVTVRGRGVTEKCTFCVQRIRGGEEQAKVEGRPLRDGEIVPACAGTCPSRAIVFGDLKDPSAEVSRLANDPRAYRLLEELNTKPGVVYLARRRDREPDKESG
jgi:anaerobic selenocysteine-containing dehydrogenase/Fe-S-cluster-containing dehydrogenase component